MQIKSLFERNYFNRKVFLVHEYKLFSLNQFEITEANALGCSIGIMWPVFLIISSFACGN